MIRKLAASFATLALLGCTDSAPSCHTPDGMPMLFEYHHSRLPGTGISFDAVSCFDTMHDCENAATAMRNERHGRYFECIQCSGKGCFPEEDY